MCAEHGFYWTLPGRLKSDSQQRWHCMREDMEEDNDWKMLCVELFKQYTKRVQGSIIEQRGCAVAWIYHQVGAIDLAQHVALELARLVDPVEPQGLMHGYPVMVVTGKGYVEVKRKDVDKGMAVLRTYKMIREQLKMPIDFVLCIGDDRSDEDMFQAVQKLAREPEPSSLQNSRHPSSGMIAEAASPSLKPSPAPTLGSLGPRGLGNPGSDLSLKSGEPMSPLRAPKLTTARKRTSSTEEEHGFVEDKPTAYYYTATVGRKSSAADYYVKDIGAVSELLQKLAKEGIRTKFSKFSSSPNLQDMAQQSGLPKVGSLGSLEPVVESD